ncbi:hypothetical protein KBH77_03525 [Patescibacteria group bacterium]|nr:hypothetical protein [Candidatus Dojkabacteria bacterium]MBP8689393.1 hypothetical protein [Patescibacteria group bacterium]
MLIKKYLKFSIYPLLITLSVCILALLHLNGSSVGIFNNVLSKDISQDQNLLLGEPRGIRSDQYMVMLPIIISQDINQNPEVNSNMGANTNLITQTAPSKNMLSLFRPTMLPFLILEDSEIAYSLYWFGEFALLLISTYLLLLILTKKNILISVLGSMIFLFTPFIHWWNQTNIITWISFILVFLLTILKEDSWKKAAVWGIGLLYSMITFLFILYPPFQISVSYIAFTLLLGYSLNNLKVIKQNLKIIVPILITVIILFLLFSMLVYNRYLDVIQLIMGTNYPGERFISAGEGNVLHLFNGFYNILLQIKSNTPPFSNQSESSNFLLLFPPIVFLVLYKSIKTYSHSKEIDWIPVLISLNLIFFTIWYLIPLPDFISKYSLLYLVPPRRLLIGFGYGSYILMFYLLGNNFREFKNKSDNIIIAILSFLFGLLIYFVGKGLYNISPSFFEYPSVFNYEYKILLASIFATFITYLLLKKHTKLFLIGFLTFSIISTIFINPLYKGLDILINTDLANYIQEISKNDDSKWIAYENDTLAQYALANNASIIDGIHLYPQFKIWKILDPEEKYINIYNRYAHINISEYEEGDEYMRLLQQDLIEINISPCDERLDRLNVKYIITDQDMSSYTCLKLRKDFSEYGIKIYNRIISSTPSLL